MQLTTTEGCVTEVKRRVSINPDVTIFIPNAFSPDDNCINEKFKAVASGITTFEISIYNRWGERMYHSTDYATHGWDGTFEMNPAPNDIYVYKVMVRANSGKYYEYNGTLQLIR